MSQTEATIGPCKSCDHDPACGFSSIWHDGKEDWYCHTDDHSCYMRHIHVAETLRQFYEVSTAANIGSKRPRQDSNPQLPG